MHERLRQVPAQLALVHVELLGVEARRPARGPGPLEEPGRLDDVALLQQSERENEVAQQEGAFGVGQRPVIVPEPIGVPLADQLVQVSLQRRCRPRVVGGHGAAQPREQQRAVQARIGRGPLPPARRVHRVLGRIGHDGVRERGPAARK